MTSQSDNPAPTTTSKPQGPTEKEKKYDRQLRLWSAEGQEALEKSHVLLINGGAAGSETLKNLILPCIGQFTIYDRATVTEADLACNFFLERSSLGKSRAEELCTFLAELNPDVKGHWINEPLETFLKKGFQQYNLVILTLPDPNYKDIIHTYNNTSPALSKLITLTSLGFYSTFKIHYPSIHIIHDTHPDPITVSDLRALEPWPELRAYVDEKTANIEQQDDVQHGHIPWLALIMYYVEQWKKLNPGQSPEKDKKSLAKLIGMGQRHGSVAGTEENFDQALKAVNKTVKKHVPGSDLLEIWDCEEMKNLDLSEDSPNRNFWLLSKAVHSFYLETQRLPVSGLMPDMKAQSKDYVKLQTIYRNKTLQDAQMVKKILQEILYQKKCPDLHISDFEIEKFCKKAAFIRVVKGSSKINVDERSQNIEGRMPGTCADGEEDDNVQEKDSKCLLEKAQQFLKLELQASEAGNIDESVSEVQKDLETACKELVEAEGKELHNIASLTGGLVSQEAIKVITGQYNPIDNECVWDGVKACAAVLKM